MKRFLLFIFVLVAVHANATHNRAGEITYRHLGGLEYEAVITTYTKTSASAADRPELEIRWGDGTRDTLRRESIIFFPTGDAQRNIYRGRHIYAGAGTFIISMEDPNRNEGVINIPSSVNVVFYIESVLTIDNALGHNNSAILLNSPLDNACTERLFVHNSGAFDPDGDSLSYRLIVCKALNGLPIPGYTFPDQWPPGPDNNMFLDQVNGNLFWDSPKFQGEYNVAFLIEEWRQGILVGSVERDMQITVFACENNPPEIIPIADTCVLADATLIVNVEAIDPDNDPIVLTAFGEPLNIDDNTAVFTQTDEGPPAIGIFIWTPECDRVRLNPYTVTIKAEDNGIDVDLVDFETFKVTVIAPGPENLDAQPLGNTVELSWDISYCDHASGYNIYRRPDSLGYVPDFCVTGVPPETGYVLIGSTEGINNTDFIDDTGLALGLKYCYMVTATFPDGAESQPSIESCAILIKDLPVITNVSVGLTDLTNGRDTIIWSNPTELNPIQFPEPYHYKVYRGDEYNEPDQLIYTSPDANDIIGYQDTIFIDEGINTQSQPNTFRIDLYSENNFVGSTFSTPSIFLSTIPNDNKLTVTWDDRTPWIHEYYEVYKFDEDLGEFVYLDSVVGNLNQYTDTGLVNLETYCYYVKAFGSYASSSILSTLINYSQETCGIPWDRTPPCPPELTVESDCEAGENFLMWTNPNNTCADDVIAYTIYYSPNISENQEDFEPIVNIFSATDTTYLFTDLLSVAGCYAVTASDSLLQDPDGNFVQNESDFSNIVCVDNCPEYVMPNVFTPNNDGVNDLLIPISVRHIKQVEFNVYNRWGTLLFQTDNPLIEWDGKDMNSNEVVSDGVYFYTIIVESILLDGNETNAQSGYVYVFTHQNNTTK